MTAPETLARPLSARVAALPEASDPVSNPPTPPAVIEAAVAALNRGETHYTTRPGIVPLRERVADTLRTRFAVDIPASAITITAGLAEARFTVVQQLAPAGKTVLALGNIVNLEGVVHLAGAKLITADPAAFNPDAVALLYLQAVEDGEPLQVLLAQAKARGWWIAWEVGPDSQGFHPAQNADLAPRVITLGSWDAVLPGWRVGWMAGSDAADKLRAFKQSMTICTTNVSQWAALALVEGEA